MKLREIISGVFMGAGFLGALVGFGGAIGLGISRAQTNNQIQVMYEIKRQNPEIKLDLSEYREKAYSEDAYFGYSLLTGTGGSLLFSLGALALHYLKKEQNQQEED
jgi:hypothetical protein